MAAVFVCTAPSRGAAPDYEKAVKPLLEKYCYDCHSDGTDKGGVELDAFASHKEMTADRKLWFDVWRNLDAQLMPPAKKAQPSAAERQLIARWIEHDVFKVDPENPDPGRVTIRRLNREEYRNTIQDLLGVTFDVTEEFPSDDTGYGFDTIGDVLTISPLLLEKYLDAADSIVTRATQAAEPKPPVVVIPPEKFVDRSDVKLTAKMIAFDDKAARSHATEIKHAGPYQIVVDTQVLGSSEATIHSAELILKLNGKEIARRDLGWDNRKSVTLETSTRLPKGMALFSLEVKERNKPAEGENSLHLRMEKFTLRGPTDGSFVVYPKEYYQVFLDGPPPKEAGSREQYARRILKHFAERAFRRPVDEATLQRLIAMAMTVNQQPGMKFEDGVAHSLKAILSSPRFLFRAEIQPEPDNPGKIVPVDEFALASRLSYFLWSSLPDQRLHDLAKEGKLRANLATEVQRMLKDPKSQRFVRNFVGQWLQTRDVEGLNVDARRILGVREREDANKIFSSRVRQAMRAETEMAFEHVLKENRSVNELIVSDYTFLNEYLAKFYGIPNVRGSEMRKVALGKDSHRGGLLTHGSVLLVTSNPTRTSPVKRGLFVLENLLGTPAPPAPPNVPSFEESAKAMGANLTTREIMVIHREKALCASCHARMDPLGLALENYNALGGYRDQERGKPIDTAGELITGEKFNSVSELARVLVTSRKKDYHRCLTEKLLTYAIGRGPEYYDTPTIEKIVTAMERDDGKMQTLVMGIIQSAPFQKRRGDGDRLLTDAGE